MGLGFWGLILDLCCWSLALAFWALGLGSWVLGPGSWLLDLGSGVLDLGSGGGGALSLASSALPGFLLCPVWL